MVSQWRLAEPAGEGFWGEANATVKKKYGDRRTQLTCAFGHPQLRLAIPVILSPPKGGRLQLLVLLGRRPRCRP